MNTTKISNESQEKQARQALETYLEIYRSLNYTADPDHYEQNNPSVELNATPGEVEVFIGEKDTFIFKVYEDSGEIDSARFMTIIGNNETAWTDLSVEEATLVGGHAEVENYYDSRRDLYEI